MLSFGKFANMVDKTSAPDELIVSCIVCTLVHVFFVCNNTSFLVYSRFTYSQDDDLSPDEEMETTKYSLCIKYKMFFWHLWQC